MGREKRQEQIKLVSKFFQKEKSTVDNLQEKIVQKAENIQKGFATSTTTEVRRMTREEALIEGENRRQDAMRRREEFLKQQSEQLAFEVVESEHRVIAAKSRQELEEDRERFLRETCERVKRESSELSQRHKQEEERRASEVQKAKEEMENEERARKQIQEQMEREESAHRKLQEQKESEEKA